MALVIHFIPPPMRLLINWIAYILPVCKKRFSSEINCSYGIDLELLQRARPNLRIMHPLPRLEELPTEIDATPYAYYFQQAHNGLFIRQALLDIIFWSNKQ